MRHIFSIIIITFIIALVIIPAYIISFLDIGFIGRGTALRNLMYYILEQDPNMEGEERKWNAEELQDEGILPFLQYLTILWFIIFFAWIIIMELLKIDRPNKAFKFVWIWVVFLIFKVSLSSYLAYYLLYSQKAVYQYIGGPQMASIVIFVIITSFIVFYLTTLFITSRVTRPVVPLATRIMRT